MVFLGFYKPLPLIFNHICFWQFMSVFIEISSVCQIPETTESCRIEFREVCFLPTG